MFKLNNKTTNLATANKVLQGALAQGLQDFFGDSPKGKGEKQCKTKTKKNCYKSLPTAGTGSSKSMAHGKPSKPV